jgi:hypothetical protein
MIGKIWGYISEYLFWAFVVVMIIIGSTLETPLLNIGETAH